MRGPWHLAGTDGPAMLELEVTDGEVRVEASHLTTNNPSVGHLLVASYSRGTAQVSRPNILRPVLQSN